MSGPPARSGGVHQVDATGLHCPLPVRALSKAIDSVAVGAVVELTASDPTARMDVPVWCRLQRHRLQTITEVAGGLCFRVERAH